MKSISKQLWHVMAMLPPESDSALTPGTPHGADLPSVPERRFLHTAAVLIPAAKRGEQAQRSEKRGAPLRLCPHDFPNKWFKDESKCNEGVTVSSGGFGQRRRGRRADTAAPGGVPSQPAGGPSCARGVPGALPPPSFGVGRYHCPRTKNRLPRHNASDSEEEKGDAVLLRKP